MLASSINSPVKYQLVPPTYARHDSPDAPCILAAAALAAQPPPLHTTQGVCDASTRYTGCVMRLQTTQDV